MSLVTARTAISSSTYEEKLKNVPKLPKEAKQKRLEALLSNANTAMQKIGQGMIGPIQIRLRYEGIVRNVLVEDTLERGPLMPYDVLDDLGRAYILNSTDTEVKITPFEGKQVYPQLFRIASFPQIKKEDLYYLRVNAVEFAQDETRQAIQKQEDARLILLLEAAIVALGAARDNGVVGTSPTGGYLTGNAQGAVTSTSVGGVGLEQSVVIGAGNSLEPGDFYNAVAQVEVNQLEAKRVLAHPVDIRDLYTWDLNVTGFEFKDKVFGGDKITQFGEFQIQRSIIVPQGETFLMAEPDFVGVFPVMYSLDVEENHQVEQFKKGWVMDELVGMLILNARGLSRILKGATAGSAGAPTKLDLSGLL